MLLKNYNKSTSGIWIKENNLQFNYSDGEDVENRLLKQVQQAEDVTLASDELQRLMVDWPSEYHFSPLRANLLSSFHLSKFANILEIGSGCGAITRLLGEQCPGSDIIALEGSMRRAEITRTRCRDLKNVNVCRDSFSDFEHADLFDLITMIGVLEYSPSYFEAENPILEALKRARRLLSSSGVLVIAIENQLGLKYFNGCAEDHSGQPFSGLNDQYLPGTVRTFGKKQLQEQIEQAGFEKVEFVYPFPDYKLPQLLLREEAFQCGQFDLSHMAGQYPSRDYSHDSDKVFRESRVWNLLAKNGLLRDLANSFLVFAFNDDMSLGDITDHWLAKAFSGRRKKRYLIETEFRKEQNEIIVEKKLSYPSVSPQTYDDSETIIHHVGKADYVKGIPYGYYLYDQVSMENSLEKLVNYLTPWMDWLREKSFSLSLSDRDDRTVVSGKLYDCMPANFLINKQKELCIIDQEWECNAPIDMGFVLFRGLYRELVSNLVFFEQTDLFRKDTAEKVVEKVFKAFSLPFNKELLENYLVLEIAFQMRVVPYSINEEKLIGHVTDFFEETRTKTISFGEFLTSGGVRHFVLLLWQKKMLDEAVAKCEEHNVYLTDVLLDRDGHISNLDQQVSTLYHQLGDANQIVIERDEVISAAFRSSSWRLTAPLRLAGYLIKGDYDKAAIAGKRAKLSIISTPGRFARWVLNGIGRVIETETDSISNHAALEIIIEERCRVTKHQHFSDPLSASVPDVLPAVDISVVTYNSEKWVNDFVESLCLLNYPKELLTLRFVDHGSNDSTVNTLRTEMSKLIDAGYTVDILQKKNRGYGAGHNTAIKEGVAPYCLVSNIDLTFEPEALRYIVSTAMADDTNAAAWELRQRPYEHPKFYDPVTGTTNWNSHACILLRRSAFEKVGGYDETLFMYGEDVELSYRLRRSGMLLRYCPRAVVNHYSYEQLEQIKPLQYSGSTFANLYLRLKYGNLKDILAIPSLSMQLLSATEPYPGANRSVLRNLMRLLIIAPKAVASRRKSPANVFFPFHTWDYEMVRDGAFIKQSELLKDSPLVTIITRTYKGRELYLRQALLSVAHQSYHNIEHIVVEDGGDSLQPLVEQIGQLTGRPAAYFNIDKLGRSIAGNVGLENARGRWCLFLDDDDLLFADHVEVLVSALLAQNDAVAAYTLAWEVQTDDSFFIEGKYTEKQYVVPSVLKEGYDYKTLQHHNLMAIQSVLFEHRLFKERGGFDSDLDVLEDWVLWLCYGFGNQFIYVPRVTSMFRTPFSKNIKDSRQKAIDSGYQVALERVSSKISGFALD